MGVTLERSPDGRRRWAVTRRLDAAPADAWDVLTDTDRWPEWGPSVQAVDAPQRYVRAGLTGRVRTVGGLWVPFRVDSCRDRRWTWTVAAVPATGHRVESQAGGCRVVFEVPLAALPYTAVCGRALDRIATLVGDDGE